MKTVKCLAVFLFFGALLVDAAVYRPGYGSYPPMRLRRLHHRSAMYYHPEMMYIPSMTSYTSGDAFTGYLQPDSQTAQDKPCQNCNNIPEELEPEPQPEPEPEPQPQPVPLPEYEETTKVHKVEIELPLEEETGVGAITEVPVIEEVTTQKTKTKILPKKPPQPEEEDEEDYEDWPYVKHQGRKVPPYNVFFPMMFGYPGSGRSGQGGPGGVTAIANAFSSGKGGVATSHATAFGNAPPLNKHNSWKKRSQNYE